MTVASVGRSGPDPEEEAGDETCGEEVEGDGAYRTVSIERHVVQEHRSTNLQHPS